MGNAKRSVASWEVSDELWKRVEPLLPVKQRDPSRRYVHKPGGGRKSKDPQVVFKAIVYVLRTGCQWRALPHERFGSASAIHKRFLEWQEAGVFEALWRAGLAEYDDLEGIVWRWQRIDSAMMKAPLAQEAVGPNPTDRGKRQQTPSAGRRVASRSRLSSPGRTVMMSVNSKRCSMPFRSSGPHRLSGAASICALMRPTPAYPHLRSSKVMAISPTSGGVDKRRAVCDRIQKRKPGAGSWRSPIAGSIASANCLYDTKSSSIAFSDSTNWPLPSSRLERFHSRSILFTDKF